jgi:hypothetical protein
MVAVIVVVVVATAVVTPVITMFITAVVAVVIVTMIIMSIITVIVTVIPIVIAMIRSPFAVVMSIGRQLRLSYWRPLFWSLFLALLVSMDLGARLGRASVVRTPSWCAWRRGGIDTSRPVYS